MKMFSSAITFLFMSLWLGIANAAEECARPVAPLSVPDGSTAGVDAMMEANKIVTQFVSDGTLYTECLMPQIEAAKELAKQSSDPAEKAAQEDLARELTQLHDAMVDEMQTIASAFNMSIKAYNARDL